MFEADKLREKQSFSPWLHIRITARAFWNAKAQIPPESVKSEFCFKLPQQYEYAAKIENHGSMTSVLNDGESGIAWQNHLKLRVI